MSQNNYLDITNYVFQKDIGEGNFGKVKLGIFRPTGEEFAIKILNKNKIKIKMKNSIFKENEIITRFNHINVVYVFQILEDQKNYYITFDHWIHRISPVKTIFIDFSKKSRPNQGVKPYHIIL